MECEAYCNPLSLWHFLLHVACRPSLWSVKSDGPTIVCSLVCSHIVLEASLDYGAWMRRWAKRDQNIQTVTYERTDTKRARGGGCLYKREKEAKSLYLKNIYINTCKTNAYEQISCKINFMKIYRLFSKAWWRSATGNCVRVTVKYCRYKY